MLTTKDDLAGLIAKTKSGEFNPVDYNWAVDVNAVPITDASAPEGWSYQERVCIFLMGDGSEQCFGMWPLAGAPSETLLQEAERLVKTTFGVGRVLRGVG